jgi:hypothetical protein
MFEIEHEFHGVSLGDERLSQRFERLGKSAAENPDASFPNMFSTHAELEGAYRFFTNERVEWSQLIQIHKDRTWERISGSRLCVVAHDTTDCVFSNHSEKKGLGRVHGTHRWSQGFFGHFSLALKSDNSRMPLGLVGAKFFVRKNQRRKKLRDRKVPNGPQNESYRWLEQVIRVEQENTVGVPLVHVMDRAGDSYELFDGLRQRNSRFVIRICRDRNLGVDEECDKLFEALGEAQAIVCREVPISRRRACKEKNKKRLYPPREKRLARLHFTAKTVTIPRSKGLSTQYSPSLTLNFIHVWEKDPPKDMEPVDWKLVTTEPIEMGAEVEQIVDYYRSRWVIEEYFKAIKTGCQFQKRQQEDLHALLNVLAVFLPIAWWLLAVRTLAKTEQIISSEGWINPIQKRLLEAKYPDLENTLTTLTAVLNAIARLGGHIKYNGPPGWQILFRGYEKLLLMEAGHYLLASSIRCDK